uniref:MAK10-like protein n=1 Tax=Tanacetum cinerariifolium TaxID=118510 RepID=A0A6L2JFI9_TANCI|nr:MAK10-like protein [Tanacetum cinerariifolium]
MVIPRTSVRGSKPTPQGFLKLVDSLDLDGENKERKRLRLFQFSLRDQASNWLKRLPAGSITTWDDLTTRFLAQFYPPGRTAKLRNDILMFQQHHRESLSKAQTRFKDLLQKSLIMASTFGSKSKLFMTMSILSQDEPLTNRPVNDPRDFAKPIKAIALPQDVPSTSDRRLIELENQVQCLMEAHLASTQPTQVNKVTTSCEICIGPHDTQYCMKDPEQAFVEYASSRTDKAGDEPLTNRPVNDPRDFAKPIKAIALPQDVPSTSDRRLIELENQVQCLMEAHLASTQPTQVNKVTTSCEICIGPHDTQYCMKDPEQAFVEYVSSRTDKAGGLVSNFMASQDAILSKFEADFKQQQSEITNKIDTVLKAITDRIVRALPSDTVKNPKLNVFPVLSARSYPIIDPQCSSHPSTSINAIKAYSKEANISQASLLQTGMGIEPQQPD